MCPMWEQRTAPWAAEANSLTAATSMCHGPSALAQVQSTTMASASGGSTPGPVSRRYATVAVPSTR